MHPQAPFTQAIAQDIWVNRYQYVEAGRIQDLSIRDSWKRVARAIAEREPARNAWEKRFYSLMDNFRFLPGGRILANAGTSQPGTLCNCFVMERPKDEITTLFRILQESAETIQQGGGIGCDFSLVLPRGSIQPINQTNSSGPVAYLHLWDAMCRSIQSSGRRGGAMIATLRCDHPDIESFIDAKKQEHQLTHFNLSVLITDAFMKAVKNNLEWSLVFPKNHLPSAGHESKAVISYSNTQGNSQNSKKYAVVFRKIKARQLWQKIMLANYENAEPGVLFIDRINRLNNLWYRETINTTNPCGELPLPDYGSCVLGSINLTRYVHQPFRQEAHINFSHLKETVATAVQFLDNALDIAQTPLAQQQEYALASRRIGLGITGLADTLIMLNIRYDSSEALTCVERIINTICLSAYKHSIQIAVEKGPFPLFDCDRYLQGEFIKRLPEDIQSKIKKHGIRNSHLLAIAPAGTISLLANNISNGIEPMFSLKYTRNVKKRDGNLNRYQVENYAWRYWKKYHRGEPLPDAFIDYTQLNPEAQLRMQSVVQKHVDSAVSKTINVPASIDYREFCHLYETAYQLGLKGCTTYRQGLIEDQVLKM